MDGEDALFHEGLGPDAVEELFLADQPARTAHEGHEQVERPGGNGELACARRKAAFRNVEGEAAERVGFLAGHGL